MVVSSSSILAKSQAMPLYGAVDLGTNNCRLLIVRPLAEAHPHQTFEVVDSFSRIVRLGEGLSATGSVSQEAIERTIAALGVCRDKLASHQVKRVRLVTTEACRAAKNGAEILAAIKHNLAMDFEVIDRKTEAHLAVMGAAALFDRQASRVLLFDIGGGSTEIVLVNWQTPQPSLSESGSRIEAWTSIPIGVVTLAEKYGGVDVTPQIYDNMRDDVVSALAPFKQELIPRLKGRESTAHWLGTSGTVTTLTAMHLGLSRYDRRRVDGQWLTREEVDSLMLRLRGMSYDQRVKQGCIGTERADLVLAGCAIVDGLRTLADLPRLRVADRGLREGMLIGMMATDGLMQGKA